MVNIPKEIGFIDKITFNDNASAKKFAKVFAGKGSCLKVLKLVNYILLLIKVIQTFCWNWDLSGLNNLNTANLVFPSLFSPDYSVFTWAYCESADFWCRDRIVKKLRPENVDKIHTKKD